VPKEGLKTYIFNQQNIIFWIRQLFDYGKTISQIEMRRKVPKYLQISLWFPIGLSPAIFCKEYLMEAQLEALSPAQR
jgi:hypothetical protein